MRDFYPDVFDGLGFLPREYGALQVFVGPVERDARGRATAEVWLQAAFEPVPAGATLSVLLGDGSGGVELSIHTLPELTGGRAVRWRIPFSVGPDAERVCFKVSAPIADSAERVRTNRSRDAASTGDSAPQPERSAGAASGADVAMLAIGVVGDIVANLALNASTLPDGILDLAWTGLGTRRRDERRPEPEPVSEPSDPPVDDMPHGFVAQVVPGEPVPVDEPEAELMWEPGRAMPRPETAIRMPTGSKRKDDNARACFSCGHSTDNPSSISCEMCGALL